MTAGQKWGNLRKLHCFVLLNNWRTKQLHVSLAYKQKKRKKRLHLLKGKNYHVRWRKIVVVCLNSITVCLCPVGRNARCKEKGCSHLCHKLRENGYKLRAQRFLGPFGWTIRCWPSGVWSRWVDILPSYLFFCIFMRRRLSPLIIKRRRRKIRW